jgi:limonene 1,2-monooxygenase
MAHRMRFGVFLAPFHKPGINPTLALEQDVELIQWLDRCGYDEAWCGEHHSAGSEISASPEIFMAVAAERTRHIKLGTGVVSVSYHNPLWVAERIVQLDHLTRGRVMLGLGPGSLPSDGIMVGISQSQTRLLLEDGLSVIRKLLTTTEPVTFKNDTCGPIHSRSLTWWCPPWPHPRALSSRACTALACCRLAPPQRRALTRWPCTGT